MSQRVHESSSTAGRADLDHTFAERDRIMNKNELLKYVEQPSLKAEPPKFDIGDMVDVHTRILEGNKERIQKFSGRVIAKAGSGSRETFVVRRIVANEGVERKFPVHSPRVAKIVVISSAVVRRAKLYFLRDRTGKAVRLKERKPELAVEAGSETKGRGKRGKKAAPAPPAAPATPTAPASET